MSTEMCAQCLNQGYTNDGRGVVRVTVFCTVPLISLGPQLRQLLDPRVLRW